MWGNLRLRRGGGKSGYYGVTKVNSKKRPFQAWIKSATRKQQGLGSFATAQRAAIEVAKALAQQDGEDLDSPRKQKPRGARAIHTRCSTLSPMSCALAHPTYRGISACHSTARTAERTKGPLGHVRLAAGLCAVALSLPAPPGPALAPLAHQSVCDHAARADLSVSARSQAVSRCRRRPRRTSQARTSRRTRSCSCRSGSRASTLRRRRFCLRRLCAHLPRAGWSGLSLV